MTKLSIALEKVDFFPPTRVTDDTSILTLKNLVFEPLLRWNNGVVQPALFSSWTHSADGRHWQFCIRPEARFHDGTRCLAEHIITFLGDILQAVDTFGMKWSYARYLVDTTITAGTDYRVDVDNPEPLADILDIFSEFFICRTAPDGFATVGTGPYRVEEFTPGESVTLLRVGTLSDYNNNQTGPQQTGAQGKQMDTRPQRVVARAIPLAADRYRLLRDGEIDAALNLERVDEQLDFDERFSWGQAVNTLSVMYYLNCFAGVFKTNDARLAVNHAIDTYYIAEQIYHGLAIPSASIVSPFHLGMHGADINPIKYDPDRAKQLFDKTGCPDAIQMRTPNYMPERALQISRFVADALEDIGLHVEIDIQNDRPEYAREVGRKEIGDMAIFDSSPHSTYRILNDKISSNVEAVWWQGFDDPETERLIVVANNSVTPALREQAYTRCLERLNRCPPWLYLVHPIDVFAARQGLTCLSIDNKGVLNIK